MIAIIDYKAGNLTSVKLAFEHLGVPAQITSQAAEIEAAERVVFPGVGAAGAAMAHLDQMSLREPIRCAIRGGKPFLGICLGTQIVLEHSEEDGGVDTMGIVKGTVRMFQPTDRYTKVPQIGWNAVRQVRSHPIFNGIDDDSEFYFVHSFHPAPECPETVFGTTDYAGVTFASVLGTGNLIATQFHPEKSGRVGLRLLENFVAWDGSLPDEGTTEHTHPC